MTSFVAWIGVDARGPTSMYFASDSRVSWGEGNGTFDLGAKLFTSNSEPEMFGFVGYVTLPQTILKKCVDLLDRSLRRDDQSDSAQARSAWLFDMIKEHAEKHPQRNAGDFTIFHGMRLGERKIGETEFRLFATKWTNINRALELEEIPVPSDKSSVLRIDGSGKPYVHDWSLQWKATDQGDTSRSVFSAFCDSLKEGRDKFSGGQPQLTGLYRMGAARTFGVVTDAGPSYQGTQNPMLNSSKIEWRDALFQRVDVAGIPLKGAQRQVRPKALLLRQSAKSAK